MARPASRPLRALLDTHVLIRWLARDPVLPSAHRRVIDAASPDNPLCLSDISLWEVAMLQSLGRIRLDLPLREWLERATAPPLVRRIGISPAVAAEVAALPGPLRTDPADRIITATARVLGATLLTQDRGIITAGVVSTIS